MLSRSLTTERQGGVLADHELFCPLQGGVAKKVTFTEVGWTVNVK